MQREQASPSRLIRAKTTTDNTPVTRIESPDVSDPTDIRDFASAVGNRRASALFQNSRDQDSSLVNALGRSPSRGQVLGLQRAIGNQATTRMIRRQAQTSDGSVPQIEQAIDKLGHQHLRKRNNEEVSADRKGLVEEIRTLHEQIAMLSDEPKKAELNLRLNAVMPYYSQWFNANILQKGKTEAKWLTCNITTLSMNLEGFGKTTADFKGDSQLINNIATVFGETFVKSRSGTANPQALRLPDFLQLVVIYVALTTQGEIKPLQIKGLGKDIGGLNDLATRDPEAFKDVVIQARNIAAQLVTFRGTFYHFSQFFGVDSIPVGRKWGSLSLSDYKQHFIAEMTQVIGSGQMVIVPQEYPLHFLRIGVVSDDGIIINDPGQWNRDHKHLTWAEAQKLGLLFSGYVVMKNLSDGGVKVNAKVPTTNSTQSTTTNTGAKPTPTPNPTVPTSSQTITPSQTATTSGQPSPTSGKPTTSAGQSSASGGKSDTPWVTEHFYEKAYSINQKYMNHPPQAGWPYIPAWRALWDTGKYKEFADAVADYQFFAIPSPVSEVDGILGAKTFHAITRTHPQYARAQNDTSGDQKIAEAVQKLLATIFMGGDKTATADSGAAGKPEPTRTSTPKETGIDKHVIARINDPSISGLIDKVAAELGMDANTIRGIIAAESGGNTQTGAGTKGYKGLMQAYQTEDQLDPETSIRGGAQKYLKFQQQARQMMKQYGVKKEMNETESITITMILYNAGPGSVKTALEFAKRDGDANRWFEDAYFVRSLLFYGAYAIGSMKSKFSALGGDKLAEELAAVTHSSIADIREQFQHNGKWDMGMLVKAFNDALFAEWKETYAHHQDRKIEEWEKVANGWLLQAARFKHHNLQQWYLDRILNYKNHYDLQNALKHPELQTAQKEAN